MSGKVQRLYKAKESGGEFVSVFITPQDDDESDLVDEILEFCNEYTEQKVTNPTTMSVYYNKDADIYGCSFMIKKSKYKPGINLGKFTIKNRNEMIVTIGNVKKEVRIDEFNVLQSNLDMILDKFGKGKELVTKIQEDDEMKQLLQKITKMDFNKKK